RVAKLGMMNSLSQLLLKLVSPGVPDTYQGTELWDFSLVDPDNRRPVDFAHRVHLLHDLEPLLPSMNEDRGSRIEDRNKVSGESVSPSQSPLTTHHSPTHQALRIHRLTEILKVWEDGRIKLFLLASGLRLRRQHPQVFLQGEYLALRASGE